MFGITLPPQIIKILAIGALLFACLLTYLHQMKKAEARGYDRAQTEYTQRALTASEAARKREADLQTQLQEAQNEARTREMDLTAAADRARTELVGLRDELTTLNDRLSRASAASLRRYATTANDVLRECTNRLTEVAREADRHASDSLMLQRGWPR